MLATTETPRAEAPTHHRGATVKNRPSGLQPLFLAIIVVGVLHMGEQLLFGIEEYYMLRDAVGHWHGAFPPTWSDQASVLLITIVVTGLSLVLYALVRSAGAARWVVGAFGLLGVTEAHHWLESIAKGGYDPGLITSVAYVGIGALILRELWQRRGATLPA